MSTKDLIGKPFVWLSSPTKITDVFEYKGKFKETYNCVIRFNAPNKRGYMDMAYHTDRYEKEKVYLGY